MSSIVHAINSPRVGAASAAAKLKGFGVALNKSFGIAKRWTLEKVGAREPSQEPAEVTALIAGFNQDKADIEELRSKVQHLITSEKTLLDADLAFAQALQDINIPATTTADTTDTSFTQTTTPSTSSSSSASPDPSSSAAASQPLAAPHPPFTPQTFASYLAQLHTAHSAYLSLLSSHLLDPIDAILDQDVALLAMIIKQLPILRLDHHAKHDALLAIQSREDKRGLEDAQTAEKESREVWEAQMEVVDKLAREVAVKKADLLRAVAEVYVRESRKWYEQMHAIIDDAERKRMVGGADQLHAEAKSVKESVEATVDAVVTQIGQVAEQLIDKVVPEQR